VVGRAAKDGDDPTLECRVGAYVRQHTHEAQPWQGWNRWTASEWHRPPSGGIPETERCLNPLKPCPRGSLGHFAKVKGMEGVYLVSCKESRRTGRTTRSRARLRRMRATSRAFAASEFGA
jgi:hypothetical protein